VVEHEVHAQAHATLAQRAGKLGEIRHRAQPRVDRPVVHDGVSAVVLAGPGLEQRHQVKVGDTQLVQIVEFVLDGPERAGEPVGVADVADHPRPLVPIAVDLPFPVQFPQFYGSLLGRREG
jgi:hypothetical protein